MSEPEKTQLVFQITRRSYQDCHLEKKNVWMTAPLFPVFYTTYRPGSYNVLIHVNLIQAVCKKDIHVLYSSYIFFDKLLYHYSLPAFSESFQATRSQQVQRLVYLINTKSCFQLTRDKEVGSIHKGVCMNVTRLSIKNSDQQREWGTGFLPLSLLQCKHEVPSQLDYVASVPNQAEYHTGL